MRPDGAGTDERIPPEERRKNRDASNSVERDVMRIAVIFSLVALAVWGTVYLRNRATLPDLDANNPALQETP
jgi:hypothetical protein